jgi:tRNA A37 methylthiotransferase MiaB
MAERLKSKLLEQDRLVDIVCGPDAYRSIPHLISLAETKDGVANVMLSADETYADVMPMRLDKDSVSGWVSVMRGCNNMCSFCIVPFTRGEFYIIYVMDEMYSGWNEILTNITALH